MLRRRWSWRLGGEGSVPPLPAAPRVLLIGPALSPQSYDSHSRTMIALMRSLRRLGYAVSFVDVAASRQDQADLISAGVEVCGRPFCGSVEELVQNRGNILDLVVLQSEPVASCYLPIVRRYCRKARVAYSVGHLSHVRMERQAQVQSLPELKIGSERKRIVERSAASAADLTLVRSAIEVGQLDPSANIHVVPPSKAVQASKVPFADRSGVAFIGSESRASNRDAVRWLVSEIIPLVWARAPEITFSVVGKTAVTSLPLTRDFRIKVLGEVPSLTPVFDSVRLTVCPLAFGSGVKGSVQDSLAAGVPCVCTPTASEGLDFAAPLSELIGVNASEIADLIVRNHDDVARLEELSAAGLSLIKDHFNEAREDDCLSRALSSVPC